MTELVLICLEKRGWGSDAKDSESFGWNSPRHYSEIKLVKGDIVAGSRE